MKRSTHKDERGYYLAGDGIYVDEGNPAKFRGADVDRLAAYEDTGLEPEDIAVPIIDVIPVVRCRECLYAHERYGHIECLHGINYRNTWNSPNMFCSYGQRKEADHVRED